jgi:transposase
VRRDAKLKRSSLCTCGHKRKNYLFCGSDAGGQRAACIYTIIETAKMCGINPQVYLADVLNRIADHLIRQIDTLLPWRWSK